MSYAINWATSSHTTTNNNTQHKTRVVIEWLQQISTRDHTIAGTAPTQRPWNSHPKQNQRHILSIQSRQYNNCTESEEPRHPPRVDNRHGIRPGSLPGWYHSGLGRVIHLRRLSSRCCSIVAPLQGVRKEMFKDRVSKQVETWEWES